MIRILSVFIILFFSLYVGLQLNHNPGYVLIAINHWTIETNFWIALFLLILIFLFLHFIWYMLVKLSGLSDTWQHYREKRQNNKEYKRIRKKEYYLLERSLYLSSITELAKHNQKVPLDELMATLPRYLKKDPQLLAEYIRFLLKSDQHAKAERLLRKQLSLSLNNTFIELYSLCYANNKQLRFAESLLKKNIYSYPLYICLGQLCIRQKLWGKAKNYLEKSVTIHPTPLAYKLLGTLYDQLNEPQKAYVNYKEGLTTLIDEK